MKTVVFVTGCIALAVLAFQAGAFVQPEDTGVVEKTFHAPGFEIRHQLQQADRLPDQARGPALRDLDTLGVPADRGLVDPRSGRWGTLIMAQPVIPGTGKGNGLGWQSLGLSGPPASENAFGAAAWDAFSAYVAGNRGALRVDPGQFAAGHKVTVQRNGDLVQIFAPREVDGVPVRNSYVSATMSHGNLVLFGAHQWDDVRLSTIPTVAQEAALRRVEEHLAPFTTDGTWGKSELVIQPLADDTPGQKGYDHRLAWVVRPYVDGSLGQWEGLVDAHSGELLSFEDTNHYATTREVIGGVLPVSNDGQVPDGVEQPGWPMPYADLTLSGGGAASCGNGVCEAGDGEDCVNCPADCNGVQNGNPNNRFCCGGGGGTNPVDCNDSRCTSGGFQCTNDPVGGGGGSGSFFTDGNGNLLACTDGVVTTTLSGRFMSMNDACGAISESTTGAVLDLGTNTGTDCSVPPGASPGNTRSSRSGFYEMNRIKEMARGQLPANPWLQDQLTSNMNLNADCNAFWNGSTVNFYTSGGGCANTGELAGVFDHEWGHGMDNNDANPSISSPGEGIADIYAALRLNQSCIGRGFLLGSNCGGYGDPCVNCDGVRDIDFAQRASGLPHDVAWADANCGSGGSTPCGGSTHCEGYVYSESVWDLEHRDLPAAGVDSNLAKEIATRLTYLGGGNVGQWYTCNNGEGGCGASGGYLNYLAADDDNGDISDGTPHMSVIFSAFDRHGIACSTPTVTDSGCAGTPSTAPTVSANGIDRAVQLSWGAITGATRYNVYRTDGVFGCDFGKTLVGSTTGTSFTDEGLLNGHEYYYTVIPIGAADTCMGPASACTTGTPAAGANAAIDTTSASLSLSGGDGDEFLDNCEVGTMTFDVGNVGNGSLTNVRISDVRTPSHPTITILTSLPANTSPSSLAACDIGVGSFDFRAENGELLFNDTVVIEVDVTSDELSAAGLVKTATLTVTFAESDFQNLASKTYTYEADIEGWSVVQGTFQRDNADGGGAQGSTWYVESSEFLANQCDQLQSPVIRLSTGSTLSAYTRFDIEGLCTAGQGCFPSQWFDRANIGIVDAAGNRTPIDPDGGRLYNASGINGTCGTEGQDGWADTADSWAESTWSSGALAAAGSAGDPVRLDVRYGTDVALEGYGFRLDHVTITDFDEQVPDGQSDTCGPIPECGDLVCNGNETQCSCPGDCGTPPSTEVGLCADGVDNDCDLFVDCDDPDCDGDPNCPTGPVCGNGICESGEDCESCSADCESVTNGRPSGRHCCGNGVLEGPEGDGRCDGNV